MSKQTYKINVGIEESLGGFLLRYPEKSLGLTLNVKKLLLYHAFEYGDSNIEWLGEEGATDLLVGCIGTTIEVPKDVIAKAYKTALGYVSERIEVETGIHSTQWVSAAYADFWSISYSFESKR